MSQPAQIRQARPTELDAVVQLLESRLPDLIQPPLRSDLLQHLLGTLLEDGCLIVAEVAGAYAGVIAIDLLQQQLVACHLDPKRLDSSAPRRLITAAEQRALSFGVRTLRCHIQPAALRFLFSLGYTPESEDADLTAPVTVCKSLEAGAEAWIQEIFELHRELGISDHYGIRHRFTLIQDCQELESIGYDSYDREQWLHPSAAAAWHKMHKAAASAGVDLQVVSAFRSHSYQAGLIRAKLARGQSLEQILVVSAAPGFSQHHSGRALDLKAPGSPALEESFAQTSAYRWLSANARFFGFRETLGKGNRHGIIWEPWHWYFHHDPGL